MRGWLRRLRGALGMGLTWAAAWTPVGAILGSVLGITLGGPLGLGDVILLNAGTFGVLGFIGGTIFSSVLRVAEGRRRFDELSLPRFAALGALGGLMLGALAVVGGLWGAGIGTLLGVAVTGVATLLGAGSAAGSLAMARQAEDRALLEDDAAVADLGLTTSEVQQQLP